MTEFRIVVTGTRHATRHDHLVTIENEMLSAQPPCPSVVCAQGGAPGVDMIVRYLCGEVWFTHCETYPADWNLNGKVAGPIRNAHMLDDFKPDLVLAFPKKGPVSGSSGTWDCIHKAGERGIRTLVVPLEVSE